MYAQRLPTAMNRCSILRQRKTQGLRRHARWIVTRSLWRSERCRAASAEKRRPQKETNGKINMSSPRPTRDARQRKRRCAEEKVYCQNQHFSSLIFSLRLVSIPCRHIRLRNHRSLPMSHSIRTSHPSASDAQRIPQARSPEPPQDIRS